MRWPTDSKIHNSLVIRQSDGNKIPSLEGDILSTGQEIFCLNVQELIFMQNRCRHSTLFFSRLNPVRVSSYLIPLHYLPIKFCDALLCFPMKSLVIFTLHQVTLE
jgi:hypothetical protein